MWRNFFSREKELLCTKKEGTRAINEIIFIAKANAES
jgi:hypothetical protein